MCAFENCVVPRAGLGNLYIIKLESAEDGNTIPFIARYRKEATGGIDLDGNGPCQNRGNRLYYLQTD
jgi:hypothetical protein